MLKLKKMANKEYEDYLSSAVEKYAQEKINSGNWPEENAIERSKKIFEKLLPAGLETENHYLFSIYNNAQHLGYIWFKIDEENKDVVFLNDIIIFKEYRGKGYGKKTMKLLEKKVKELNCKKIQLHVFGHNKVAISLYKKLNFKITNLKMEKNIKE